MCSTDSIPFLDRGIYSKEMPYKLATLLQKLKRFE
uniref:Uncharacterized protein n=1 Tax=Medicago truncatula TaxID=3880 RepID=Q2HS13_MEDTR|nr:hypothetical protein MtrDRAFT_AC157504g20v2 [Medicago truncatula]